MNRLVTVLILGLLVSVTLPAAEPDPSFDEVWYLAARLFYDPEMAGLDWQAVGDRYRPLAAAAPDAAARARVINEMLDELGTSHTRLITAGEPAYFEILDIFREALDLEPLFPNGRVCMTTIGIVAREIDGKTFLADVHDGSPAAEAGLLVGDEVLAADGEPFHGLRSFEGKAGVPVTLEVRRTPSERLTIEVTPIEVEPREMFLLSLRESARVIERGDRKIAYLRARSYAGPHYHDAVVELVTGGGALAGADALVLDLRGSWGGANPDNLNLFHQRVPVMTMLPRGAEPMHFDPQWRKPVVLLVDGSARSGKELLAYGFKKYDIGPVVGERTAGAVMAGRALLLSDWSFLYLAVFDVRVDGERLEGRGVEPDVVVERPIPYAAGADPQLERALEVAAGLTRPTTAP